MMKKAIQYLVGLFKAGGSRFDNLPCASTSPYSREIMSIVEGAGGFIVGEIELGEDGRLKLFRTDGTVMDLEPEAKQ